MGTNLCPNLISLLNHNPFMYPLPISPHYVQGKNYDDIIRNTSYVALTCGKQRTSNKLLGLCAQMS